VSPRTHQKKNNSAPNSATQCSNDNADYQKPNFSLRNRQQSHLSSKVASEPKSPFNNNRNYREEHGRLTQTTFYHTNPNIKNPKAFYNERIQSISRNTNKSQMSTHQQRMQNQTPSLHLRKMNFNEIQDSVNRLYFIPKRNDDGPKFQTIHNRPLSRTEIDCLTNRLYRNDSRMSREQEKPNKVKLMDKDQLDKLLQRLNKSAKVPDSCRVIKTSDYKNMGLLQSYAWKGFN